MNEEKYDILSEETPPDEEFQDLGIVENRRRVFAVQSEPEIDSLYRKWKDGDLELQPEFQRGFVWDILKASRLIESIFLDIPLPVIYLSEDKNGREYVIDGQQRLTTFFSFIDGALPNPKLPAFFRNFKLKGLTVFSNFNGFAYCDLPKEYQKKFRTFSIRSITLRKESDSNLKFEVFERLNTGSVSLNDQELRNCIYRGNYNELLCSLAEYKPFRNLLGMNRPEKRMRDIELVLRFAAFFHSSYQNYSAPMKKFLNDDMARFRNISESDSDQLANAFKNAVSLIQSMLGDHAFKRYYPGKLNAPNGRWEKKQFNASLYDILMDSFARRDKNMIMNNKDAIFEAFVDLLSGNKDFVYSIELNTSSIKTVNERFRIWYETLDKILNTKEKQPRCFSFDLKELLFKTDPKCSICNQRIVDIDDAAIDHIEQFWLGGQTVQDNARLTHRYCNAARSKGVADNIILSPDPDDPEPGRRRVLPKGCTVNSIHYPSAAEAVRNLVQLGIIPDHDIPKSSTDFHLWLKKQAYYYGYSYERDKE